MAPEIIARALATFPGAPERMERIMAGQPYTVMVDYAHIPASLEKAMIVVLGSAREGEQFTCVAGRRNGIRVALEMARGRCGPTRREEP